MSKGAFEQLEGALKFIIVIVIIVALIYLWRSGILTPAYNTLINIFGGKWT